MLDNPGLNHAASSGYRPKVEDDFGNEITTLQADMTGSNCCAWTNVRQFDEHNQYHIVTGLHKLMVFHCNLIVSAFQIHYYIELSFSQRNPRYY